MNAHLLMVMAGTTYEEIRRDYGDFDKWFSAGLGGQVDFTVVRAHEDEPLPADLSAFDGVIISGSPASVTEWTPWMQRAGAFIRTCVETETPLLGVCFGHQLMGQALGGRVAQNPAGREIGTVEAVLTRAGSTDKVLGPLVPSFRVQATHVDSVVEPPPAAEILARTAQENCAAMRVGRNAYGVQFHPELTPSLMRKYISLRSKVIDGERGPGAADKLHTGVQETPSGELILRRFLDEVVIPHRRARGNGHVSAPRRPTARPRDGVYREAFATAHDEAPIFYSEVGVGAPAVMMFDGLGCDGYIWKYLADQLRPRHTIVRWNYAGHGRSAAPRGWPHVTSPRLTVEGMADDAIRVLDDAGIGKAVLMGHSLGVQVALETWRRHHDRVHALVLVCGSYGNPLNTFHGHDLLARFHPVLRRAVNLHPTLLRAAWKRLLNTELAFQVAMHTELNGDLVQRADFAPYLRHLAGMDPALFVEAMGNANRHSAHDYLAAVDVPALVVAGANDSFTPASLSHHMATTMPHAELLHVPAGTHTAPIEIPELVSLRVEKFFDEHVRVAGRRVQAPQNGWNVSPGA